MRQAGVEPLVDAAPNRFQSPRRGLPLLRGAGDPGRRFRHHGRLEAGNGPARNRLRQGTRQGVAGEGHGGLGERFLDDAVDQAGLGGLRAVEAGVFRRHGDRRRRADEARQPLGAAGAGNDAEIDLGQGEAGIRFGEPKPTAQSELQPAAEGRAAHRCDPRLCSMLDATDQLGQQRQLDRPVEFGDVGAADEELARPGQNHRAHRWIGVACVGDLPQPGADGAAQRVDGRIVDGDHGNLVGSLDLHDHVHLLQIAHRPMPRDVLMGASRT